MSTRTHRRRRGRRGPAAGDPDPDRSGMGAIGWLFADMMIGLFVIALAAQAAPLPTTALASRVSTPPGKTAEPARAPAPDARMEQAAEIIAIDIDAKALMAGKTSAERATRRAIRDEVAELAAGARHAALVLVWGYAPDVGAGMAIAGAAEAQLDAASEDLFAGAITREFWHRGSVGRVTLEIYLFGDRR